MRFLIADYWNEKTIELQNSLIKSEIDCQLVLLSDDGNTPYDALNPYFYYTGIAQHHGRSLQFNEIEVPPLYEIRHYSAVKAVIIGEGIEKGYVYYFNDGKRTVNRVDWLSPKGKCICSDIYARNGLKFSTHSYTTEGKIAQKHFYNQSGETVITVDMFTQTYECKKGNKQVYFDSLTAFVVAFLTDLKLTITELYINSLAYPLFIANRVNVPTTLFWQEMMQADVPGNMKMQLENKQVLRQIVFESELELQKVKRAIPETHVKLSYLAPIREMFYDANIQQNHAENALILTASDEIHLIEEVLARFPTLQLKIAAKTEMSPKLLRLGTVFPNVQLLPQVTDTMLNQLTITNTLYFDFNTGSEVEAVIAKVFRKNFLIFALNTVAKNPRFETVYSMDEKEMMFDVIGKCLQDRGYRQKLLQKQQQKNGPLSSAADYQKRLV